MAEGKNRTVFEMLLQATQVDRMMRHRTQEVTKTQGDITTTEWLLLSIVDKGPKQGLTMSALGQTLGVTRPQISALIDQLLAKRLIRQQRSAHDGRSRTAVITERGKDSLRRINKALDSSFSSVFKAVPGTHLQIYQQVQDEIIRKSQ